MSSVRSLLEALAVAPEVPRISFPSTTCSTPNQRSICSPSTASPTHEPPSSESPPDATADAFGGPGAEPGMSWNRPSIDWKTSTAQKIEMVAEMARQA